MPTKDPVFIAKMSVTIDVAKEMKLPTVSKLDKANGIVEFGGFEGPMLGTTAQVRIRSDKNLDVTIKRGSAYVPLSVDKTAAEFKRRLEERLQQIAKKSS